MLRKIFDEHEDLSIEETNFLFSEIDRLKQENEEVGAWMDRVHELEVENKALKKVVEVAERYFKPDISFKYKDMKEALKSYEATSGVAMKVPLEFHLDGCGCAECDEKNKEEPCEHQWLQNNRGKFFCGICMVERESVNQEDKPVTRGELWEWVRDFEQDRVASAFKINEFVDEFVEAFKGRRIE